MKNLGNGLREKIYENKIAKKCLALLLALSMTVSFVMPYEDVFESAFTASAEEELVCGKEEHVHSEDCCQLICTENQEIQSETEDAETSETSEAVEEHVHDENCYELACVLEEHIHNELCYAVEESNEQEEEPDEDISGFSDFSFFDVFPATIAVMQSEFPPSRKPDVDTSGSNKPNTDKQYFESPANNVGSGSYEIKESDITSVTVDITGSGSFTADGEKIEENVTVNGESAEASFSFSYSISKSEHNITKDNPCIYYQLPEGVEIPTEYYGWTCYVTDPNYTSPDGDNIAGYYSINKDGLIVIQFIDDYVENVIMKSDSFAGSLRFNGRFNRANSQSGDRSVDMGNLSLKFDFPDKNSTVTKSYATPVYDSDGNVKISWTVKVTNVANPADIAGYVLKDSQSQFFNAANVKVSPSNVGKFNGNGEFVFNENANTVSEITFTYTQTISKAEYLQLMQESPDWGEEFTLTSNKAELLDGDETISQSSKDVKAKKPTIVKSGEPSYQNGKFIDDVIYWTIDVKAPEGSTLNGYFVEDDAFTTAGGLVSGDGADENGHKKGIVITDSSGKELKEGEDYTITGNRIEFTGNFTSVKIKYATDKKATDGKVSNKAKVIYPDGKDGPEATKDVQYTGSRYNLNNKTGTYNYDTEIFTWTIGADIPNKSNKNNYLNGFLTLHDNALKDIALDKIKVTANWNNTVTDFETKVVGDTIVISKDGVEYGVLEKTDDGFKLTGGTAPDHYLHSISLTYETTKDNEGLIVSSDGTTTTYTNEVHDDNGNSKSHGIGVRERSEIGKTVSADGENTGYWDENADDKVLHWTVNLTEDNGFAKDSVFTDMLSSSNNDAKHYFDESSLNLSIVLRTKKGEEITLKEGEDFTKTVTDNKLTITFLKDFTDYTYAEIKYNSKAEIKKMGRKGDDWELMRAAFSNKAHYKDDKSASYTYTSKNPEYIETFTLSLKKTWKDGNDLTSRPDYIYVRLQRRLPNGEWEYIYPDDDNNWQVVTVEDETDIEDHTFAVSRSGGYYQYWENLPKDTADHNGDYEYRIVELDVDGYTVSYQEASASFSSKTYEVTNTKTNNINKYVLDKDGNRIKAGGRLPLDDIILATLNEKHAGDVQVTGQYYLIGYEIVPSIVDDAKYTVIDTIPEGWMLSYMVDDSSYEYQPFVESIYAEATGGIGYGYLGFGNLVFNADDPQKVYFYNIEKSTQSLKYYLAIPKADLEEMINDGITIVSNTAEIEDGDKSKAEVVVSKEKTDYEIPSLITKDVANAEIDVEGEDGYNASSAVIRYKILVNPNAQKLAPVNKSTYDITDILNIMDPSIKADIISVTAKEVKLKAGAVPDSSGKYSLNDVEDVNDGEPIVYSYVPGDDSVTETDISDKFVFPSEPNLQSNPQKEADRYKTDSQTILKEGMTFKFTIKGKYIGNYGDEDVKLYIYCTDGSIYYNYGAGYTDNMIQKVSKVSGDKFEIVQTYTVTEKDMQSGVQLCDFAYYIGSAYEVESIEVKAVERKVNNSGELVITVPDSKALLIEYAYRISKEGGFDANGEIVYITNEASINTGSVSSWDKEDNTKFVVTDSSADVHAATKYIKLFKRDINDYNLKIGADFYIAYYDPDTQKWVFCDTKTLGKETVSGTDIEYYELTFNAEAQGNEIPSGAEVIDINKEDSTETLGSRNIVIPSELNGKIFKVIEVPTEPGYEGTNIGTRQQFKEWLSSYLKDGTLPSGAESYKAFFDNYSAVHYFAYFYNTTSSSGSTIDVNNVPDGVDYDEITKVADYEGFTVDNNKLLNITVDKQWNGGNFQSNYAVTMKLYYSYEKVTNGSFPGTLIPADAETLGITDSSFKATVTLNQGQPSYTWKNLPTSLDGKRIYYYVREEMYTINGTKWYTLQSDGTYRNGTEKGSFTPSYDGNGISKAENGKDTAAVSVNNVSGLYFRKIWLDYYGGEMSSDLAELPETLKVKVSGTLTADHKTYQLEIYRGTDRVTDGEGWLVLEKSKSYMFQVTSDITFKLVDGDNSKTYKAKDFSRFSLIEEDTDYLNNNYNKSPSESNVSNGNGMVSIINQKKAPTPIAITAEKSWVGNPPEGAKITLKLYRTTDTSITSDNFKEYLDKPDKMEQVKEITLPTADGKWTYTWDDLTQKDEATKKDYRYFIYEDTTGLTGYKPPVYTNQGRTGGGKITVTNSPVPKAQLEIEKHWSDPNAADLPDSITVDLYRKVKEQSSAKTVQLAARSYRLSTAVVNYNVDYEETGTLEFDSITQDGIAILGFNDITPTYDEDEGYYLYEDASWYSDYAYPKVTLMLPSLPDGTIIQKAVIEGRGDGDVGFYINAADKDAQEQGYYEGWTWNNDFTSAIGKNLTLTNGVVEFTFNLPYDSSKPYCKLYSNVEKIDSIKIYIAKQFSVDIDKNEIDVNGKATITASDEVTFEVIEGKDVVSCNTTDNKVITVTGLKPGTATIRVTHGADTKDFVVTVHGIAISPDSETRLAGVKEPTIKFTVEHTNGEAPTVEKISEYGDAVSIEPTGDGKYVVTVPYPSGVSDDIATGIEVQYLVYYGNKGNSKTFTLNINPKVLTAEIVGGVTSVDVGDTFQIRVNKKTEIWDLDSSLSLNSTPVQDENGYWIYTITATGEKDVEGAKIVVGNPDDTAQKINLSIDVKMVYKEAEVDTKGLEHIRTIVLKPDGSGKYVVTDAETLAFLAKLPVTDDNGQTYIYYIKEQNTGLNGYVPWKYVNNGSALKESGKTTMHIYNGKDKTESEGIELPSVGGIGTHPYTAAGFAIMSASAAIMFIKRRKRRSL